MSENATIRSRAIRLAYANPTLRPHLLPLLSRKVRGEESPRPRAPRPTNPAEGFYNKAVPVFSTTLGDLPRLSEQVPDWATLIARQYNLDPRQVAERLSLDAHHLDEMVTKFLKDLMKTEEILARGTFAYFARLVAESSPREPRKPLVIGPPRR